MKTDALFLPISYPAATSELRHRLPNVTNGKPFNFHELFFLKQAHRPNPHFQNRDKTCLHSRLLLESKSIDQYSLLCILFQIL